MTRAPLRTGARFSSIARSSTAAAVASRASASAAKSDRGFLSPIALSHSLADVRAQPSTCRGECLHLRDVGGAWDHVVIDVDVVVVVGELNLDEVGAFLEEGNA